VAFYACINNTKLRLGQFYQKTELCANKKFSLVRNVVDRGVLTGDVGGTCGPSWTPWSAHYLL